MATNCRLLAVRSVPWAGPVSQGDGKVGLCIAQGMRPVAVDHPSGPSRPRPPRHHGRASFAQTPLHALRVPDWALAFGGVALGFVRRLSAAYHSTYQDLTHLDRAAASRMEHPGSAPRPLRWPSVSPVRSARWFARIGARPSGRKGQVSLIQMSGGTE